MNDLQARIEKLERQSRRVKIGLALVLIVSCALLLLGQAPPPQRNLVSKTP